MIPKALASAAQSDVEDLIRNGRAEDRRIEYKEQLPGTSDEEKREFLADVSSFANTIGGDILYGVSEAGGVPTAAHGVAMPDVDAERRRLQSILQSGIDPRIPRVEVEPIGGFAGGSVVVVRVHDSWLRPHMVTFKNLSRFYVRDAGQRHQMDVQELRSAFLGGASFAAEVRRFRDGRLVQVLSGETPVPVWAHVTTVIHVVPFGPAFSELSVDPAAIGTRWGELNDSGFVYGPVDRFNLDGLLIYSGPAVEKDNRAHQYIQVFRNGGVEGVMTFSAREQAYDNFYGDQHEKDIIDFVRGALRFRGDLGLPFPVLVMISLLRFRGVKLLPPSLSRPSFGVVPYDRDTILLPDVIIETPTDDVSKKLRPAFDTMWQGAGYKGSRSYDTNGTWHRPL
jgi:hypothetical protein